MVGTRTMRSWWSDYRCLPGTSLETPITLFGRNAGTCAAPTYDGFKALEAALLATDYANVRSVWIPRACPTGISGRTCQSDGTNCSLHNYGIAVDIDPFGYGNDHFFKAFGDGWDFSDCKLTRSQVEAVEGIKNTHGEQYFRWLGWLIGDTMHFELQVPPGRTEVDWDTVPGGIEMPQLPLTKGMESEDVRSLQDRLNRAYGSGLTEDAIYGPATSAAVAASPMPSYTGDNRDVVQRGERVNANMWNGLFEDWVRKIAGSGNGLTRAEADQLYQEAGKIPSHGHRYAPEDHDHDDEAHDHDDRYSQLGHSHKGTVVEKTEVTLT